MYEVASFDWQRAIRVGSERALENTRSDVQVQEWHVIWELLCEAAEVSKTYSAPPRTGMPSKSAMPDAPDDVTHWQKLAAYLRGELEEMSVDQPARIQPSAEQISRSEVVLEIWHNYALKDFGDRKRMKKAVYLKACGVKDRKIRAATGKSKQAIHEAKKRAMLDMWEVIRRY